ncbi:MAG: TAXI family TRAP transporter solute-binding subunit [Acaryochloris sp. RU_4_1]|nr:TAXI family TRAP transporter solute-binding subunit [Acaryochloris sp. RU_4_1]NJR53230.1 TAXI family TRAP transporter solute-binding subunit [Acaryochloris sp. CRU_2_0]
MNRGHLTFALLFVSLLTAGGFAVSLVREHRQVHVLKLATASPSGEYYRFGQALAKVVARHYPQIQIEVVATEGSSQNLALIKTDSAQLAFIQGDTSVQESAQAVALLFPEVAHVVVNTQSGIETMADLQGKQIVLPPKGSGSYQLFMPIAQHYGIQAAQLQPLSTTEAYSQLRSGKADVFFQVIRPGSTAVRQLLRWSTTDRRSSPTLRLLPIEQIDALRLTYPYLEEASIPQGTYGGAQPVPAQTVKTVAVRALFVARRQVSEEVMYAITRVLQDRKMELVAAYPPAFTIEPPPSQGILGWPMHPGAERYYNKNQPTFWVQYAEPLGLLLSLGVLVASSLWQLRLRLVGRQKNRADMYNLQLLELIEVIQNTLDLEELNQARQRLFAILQAVVIDLDKDRISPESFQSFTLPWELAIATLRHQETLLLKTP